MKGRGLSSRGRCCHGNGQISVPACTFMCGTAKLVHVNFVELEAQLLTFIISLRLMNTQL